MKIDQERLWGFRETGKKGDAISFKASTHSGTFPNSGSRNPNIELLDARFREHDKRGVTTAQIGISLKTQ